MNSIIGNHFIERVEFRTSPVHSRNHGPVLGTEPDISLGITVKVTNK